MAKILGIDLGTNSIGWAVIDDEQRKILNTGVRIFPEGIEPTTIGQGDKEKSKNATRRDNRQIRRQNYRTRLRRIKLLETLIEYRMCPLSKDVLYEWKKYDKTKGKEGRQFPDKPEFIKWLKQNPYQLRAKAVKENISLEQLGRIFYHMIQRRGFLSNRKGNDDGKIFKGKDNITGIDKTRKQIEDTTLGSFLYSIYPKENKPYKDIIDKNGNPLRIRSRYTLRDMYIAEFEKIWQRQSECLGLNNKTARFKKERFLKGSVNTKRNKNKIEYLKNKYGLENFKIDGKKITTYQNIPLKKYLAGEINFHDNILKHKSQESVLFYQRPLRSQKGLLSKCSLEARKFYDKKSEKWIIIGPTPCPLSHPEYEEYRALQFINNIEYGTKNKLDEFQVQIILDLINKKDANFDFVLIPKELKLTGEHFNYGDKQKVSGNYTHAKLKPLFSDEIWEKHKEDIWHCFYFYQDNDMLIEKLKKDYGLKEKDIYKIEKINLKDDYSNISLKAIRNILPFMRKEFYATKGIYIKNSEAVFLGGVKNAFGDRWDYFSDSYDDIIKDTIKILRNKNNKEGEAIELIKNYLSEPNNYYGFMEDDKKFKKLYHHSQNVEKEKKQKKLSEIENLRNPIVQQGINELRRLINTLIDEYSKNEPDFKFDQIKVELARDLRSGKKQRQNTTIRMSENNKKNEKARQRLTEYGLRHSRENIQKYLLFDEIMDKNGKAECPYTGKIINTTDLLGDENKFQIEHIIPRSISLDDSFLNKTICDSKFNGLKGNKTPYQFYCENKDKKLWDANSWEEIEQRAFKLLPFNKAKRFISKNSNSNNQGFIERQLNDTRYISKKAKEILSQICDDVRVMPGSLTSELRHLWGLNNVLQPIKVLKTSGIIINENKPTQHWIVLNENNQAINFKPIFNEKPHLEKNETTISGNVNKGVFTSKYFKQKIETPKLNEGEYWAKLKLSEKPLEMIKAFSDKPKINENEIILRGKIKNRFFENITIGRKIKINKEDGKYWAKFNVLNIKFEIPEKDKQPKKKNNQILLYGNVKDGLFKSYVYECNTKQYDGNYWIIIDIDIENVEFINTRNNKPNINENKIIINGTINDEGEFSSEIDAEHIFKTESQPGKYWAVFDVLSVSDVFYPIENEEPEIIDKQKIIEGNIWLDKQSGEIKYDPKKNRDDHRHHAIDAIAIALTKQSYLQKLSTYNANKDEKFRGNKYDKPKFDEPWDDFFNDVKKAASRIIISHKKNNNVLTQITKTVYKNGVKFKSKGYAARGQLHDKTYYGKNKRCNNNEFIHRVEISKLKYARTKGQAVYIHDIIASNIKKIILEKIQKLLNENEKDIFSEILKREDSLILFSTKKEIEKEEKEINKLKNKIKESVERILKTENFYLDNYGKRAKRLNKYNLLDVRDPIPIKKVRVKKRIRNAPFLKGNKIFAINSGKYIPLKQFVISGKNHHVLIYKDTEGNLHEEVVTFWTAVERKLQKQPLYQLPIPEYGKPDPLEIITTLEINDMFLLGLPEEEFECNKNNLPFLSKHLYKVEAISSKYYEMRHHLEASQKREFEPFYYIISSLGKGKKGWQTFNPIKVKIDYLGKITKIEK